MFANISECLLWTYSNTLLNDPEEISKIVSQDLFISVQLDS